MPVKCFLPVMLFKTIRLVKHYSLIVMHQNTVLNMPFNRTRQHNPLNRTADPLQLVHIIAVADPLHVLLDNRSAIQLFCYIVGSRSDNLNPALVCLRIRLPPTNAGRNE